MSQVKGVMERSTACSGLSLAVEEKDTSCLPDQLT